MAREPAKPRVRSARRPVIIGIAGGIGSGKSFVAGVFRSLGCDVVDSDAHARDVLRSGAVVRELVRWWGPGVLDSAGMPDRGAIARIVFADAAQRARLESLVHPLVKEARARVVEASAAHTVIVDAPLLFEAGVDRECDEVVFVDTPREVRLLRVRSSRGWSEEELDRRERAQMPLQSKRERCRYSIRGDAPTEVIRSQARDVLVDAHARHRGSPPSRLAAELPACDRGFPPSPDPA